MDFPPTLIRKNTSAAQPSVFAENIEATPAHSGLDKEKQ